MIFNNIGFAGGQGGGPQVRIYYIACVGHHWLVSAVGSVDTSSSDCKNV